MKPVLYNKHTFVSIEDEFRLLTSHLPRTEILADKSASILAFGSCFADNISRYLTHIGYKSERVALTEYMNTPMANLAILEHSLLGSTELFDEDIGAIVSNEYIKRIRLSLTKADVVVFTVGVGFVWTLNGKPVIHPNMRKFTEYRSSILTTENQTAILSSIINLVRKYNDKVALFLTLSPVPLEVSTASPAALESDCISKSLLRTAIHFLSVKRQDFTYFPTFELFRWLSGHFPRAFYGADGKVRHVDQDIVQLALDRFVEINGGIPFTRPDAVSATVRDENTRSG